MSTPPHFSNPILNADWPDPDVIEVDGVYYLVASSFNRAPGLPLLRSTNLVDWSPIGHALPALVPAEHYATVRPGCGVWAPALRHHDGRFWIFYPDPDQGIFVIEAADPTGPWSEPHLLLAGRGIIDPCPLWDDDGSAYLVHGWAASRAGIKNRLSVRRMSADARRIVDDRDVVVIDGADLPGYTTLEGPKFYKHLGYYWIFAPAGGVATGWQSAFRATSPYGPYEGRIVLTQGESDVNGPHQGAWVRTPLGEDWFIHFQDRGPYGRVAHLQPLSWTGDDWPVIGRPVPGEDHGLPVLSHAYPAGTTPSDDRPADGDTFTMPSLGPQWHWQANPQAGWVSTPGNGTIVLHAVSAATTDLRQLPNLLCQIIPGSPHEISTSIDVSHARPGVFTGLAVVGLRYAWLGLRVRAGSTYLCGGTDGQDRTEQLLSGSTVLARVVTTAADRAYFSWRTSQQEPWRDLSWDFPLVKGQWIGAELGIFAATTEPGDDGGDVIVGEVRVQAAVKSAIMESAQSADVSR